MNPHIKRLLTHLPRAQAALSALDIGCGNGRIALAIASSGASVTAFDRTWRFPIVKDGNVKWLIADLHTIQFRVQFDVVLLLGVFHYMQDAVDVEHLCRKLHAWTKSGGVLLAEWITDAIPHTLPNVYLPSLRSVRESLRLSGFTENTCWLTDVEHAHDGPLHRHELAYGVWTRQ